MNLHPHSVRRTSTVLFNLLKCFYPLKENTDAIQPDKYARRIFGAWCGLLGTVVQSYFVFLNTCNHGIYLENLLDMASIVFLLASMVLLCRFNTERSAYRLGIATIIFVCTYTVLMGEDGADNLLPIFFVLPAVILFLLGLFESIFWLSLILPGLTLYCLFPEWLDMPAFSNSLVLRFLFSMFVFTGYSALVQYLSERSLKELQRADDALRKATAELKVVGGLVPVCSYCRKIRDEKGYWRQLEAFLKKHTNAYISSGVCSDCAARKGKNYQTSDFPIPASFLPMFEWKRSHENMRRSFVVYAGIIGSALLWTFIMRDFVHGDSGKAFVQVAISILLMGIVWYQHRTTRPGAASALLVVILFALLVQPFFFTTAESTEMLWFYLFPLVAGFLLSIRFAVIASLILFAFSMAALFLPHYFHLSDVTDHSRFFFLLTFFIVSIVSLIMAKMRTLYERILTRRINALEQTFQSIRTIKGLIPVCRECKAIRNDKGFWTSFDNYFKTHTDLLCSHGICESCLEKEAPGLANEPDED